VTAPGRAARIAAIRTVLDIAGQHPEIRFPDIESVTILSRYAADWWLSGDHAAEHMAALEAALPCELHGSVDAGATRADDRWVLEGVLDGGFKVKVSAPALLVADCTVTTEQVEHREWARKPVPADEPQEGPAAEEGGQ
jgi:hypothetical protein